MSIEDRISNIVSRMTIREPFIATVFTKLERVYDDPRVTTGATDGTRVYFCPEFCEKLDDEQLLFLCLHEGAHVIFMHMWRRGDRRPDMWNIANDAIINRILVNDGYKFIQSGILYDWVHADSSSEEVYAKLMQNPPPPENGGGGGSGDGDELTGGGGFDGHGDLMDAEDGAGRADMEATIVAAAKMAKACGIKSGMVDRVLSGELDPVVPWTEVLRQVMTAVARTDYSFSRLNRRMLHQGVYMPSLHSDAMGGIVIGVDTSGSVGDAQLAQIAAEITAIVEDCRPDWVEVVYCDTEVKSTQRFLPDDPIELKPNGGGGTAFKPVFDYVARSPDKVAAVVYLTDLYGDVDECEEPECPTVWGVIGRTHLPDVPFGTVVGVV